MNLTFPMFATNNTIYYIHWVNSFLGNTKDLHQSLNPNL